MSRGAVLLVVGFLSTADAQVPPQGSPAGRAGPASWIPWSTSGSAPAAAADRSLPRAIAIDDGVLVGTDDLAIEHASQANLLAHLANGPWPLYNVPWR